MRRGREDVSEDEVDQAIYLSDGDINNAQKSIAKKALRDFVVSVEPVSNQVIVKTTTAAAQVVAEAIDNLYIDDIAASIAGDNIVLIISYGNKEAVLISKSLDSYLI